MIKGKGIFGDQKRDLSAKFNKFMNTASVFGMGMIFLASLVIGYWLHVNRAAVANAIQLTIQEPEMMEKLRIEDLEKNYKLYFAETK